MILLWANKSLTKYWPIKNPLNLNFIIVSIWFAGSCFGLMKEHICANPNKRNFDENSILLILNKVRAASFIHIG
jgi:hypothetical protein